MSNTTYALAALPHRSIKDTKVINLRVTTNRKPKYKSLKINIAAKNWDTKNQKVKGGKRGEPNADTINEKIQGILLQAQTQKTTNIGKKENSFMQSAQDIIASTHSTGTKQNRERAFKKLQEYLNHRGLSDLPFNKLDNIFVEGYYAWLIKESGLKTSTANEYMQILNQVIDKIDKNGKHNWDVHPFVNYKRKRTDSLLEVLDDKDLDKLTNYIPNTAKQRQALHIFFFMMHLSGIRISDALTLTFNNFFVDGRGKLMVRYKSQKPGRVVTTRVSIEAALEMTTFLRGYGQEDQIKKLHESMKQYLSIKQAIEKNEKDRDQLKPYSLTELQIFFSEFPDDFDKQKRILDDQVQNEQQMEILRNRIEELTEKSIGVKETFIEIITGILMSIKKHHPNDTVIPLMRGIYNGEEEMSDEVEAICNAHKTKNNHHLKKIAKKVGIKKKMSNHQARHVFAMRLFLQGVNLHHISLALGHANISTTDKYRQKLVDDGVHDVTDDFSESFRTNFWKENSAEKYLY